MNRITCPACGTEIALPPRKSGFPWWAGCLMAAAVIPMAVAIIGILAAIAVPNFARARNESQRNACIANLKQIEGAKEQWALSGGSQAVEPEEKELRQYFRDSFMPTCPAGGRYTYHPAGEEPECSVHGTASQPVSP